MSCLRTIMICVLSVALTATSAARPPDSSPPDDDSRITPDEEREARELVGEFNRKFVETSDIAPLVKDYFVPDFASRLIEPPNVFPFSLIDWKDESAPPKPEDLQRFYAAATNFLHDYFPLYAAGLRDCAREEGEERDEKCDGDDPGLEKVLPPAAIEIMKAAPQLREWLGADEEEDTKANAADARSLDPATSESPPVAEVAPPGVTESLPRGEGAEGRAGPGGDENQKIRNGKELRRLTSVFETLNQTLRAHLKAHPVTFEMTTAGGGELEGDEFFANFDPERIKIFDQARVLKDEFYGYPKGTRLVCANAGALHVELVRVDGRLRILTVHLLIDD